MHLFIINLNQLPIFNWIINLFRTITNFSYNSSFFLFIQNISWILKLILNQY